MLVHPHQVEAVRQDALATDGVVRAGDPRVIAATRMCDKGGSDTIAFTAPPPGDHPFVRSTPGHAEAMRGILHVTP